jgi:SAM-dependent methyltransferase
MRLPRTQGVSSTDIKKKINTVHREKVTKTFWESRANLVKNQSIGLFQATSLTTTEEAAIRRKDNDLAAILYTVKKTTGPRNLLLDLGCGVGRITAEMASQYEKIHAIDYMQDFIDVAKSNVKATNIEWHCGEAHTFPKLDYDCCLISGLLVYLADDYVAKVLDEISYIPTVILKESVGTTARFELSDDHYSDELKSTYTGTYRTASEIAKAFSDRGYALTYTEVVEKHRKETNLQVFLFEK